MIKTILFDWGGVFRGQAKFSTFIHKMCKKYNVTDFERIKKEAHLLWHDAKLSQISSQIFFENLSEEFNLTPKEFENELIQNFKYNKELVEIAKKLKSKGYKIGVFTNNIKEWFEENLKEMGMENFFDYTITSYDYKLAKPQKEIYEKVLEIVNCEANEIVFIDDLERNLFLAKKLGFQTILYIGNEKLMEELENVGIKI